VTLAHEPDRTVSRVRILAALDRFEREWDELDDASSSRDGWEKMNIELDALRGLVGCVPELNAAFAELIMRQAQVLRSLTKHSAPGVKAAEVAALRRRHKSAIEALRTQCVDGGH
jgi:hypothetical protein